MPAIITHHLFGIDVHRVLASTIGSDGPQKAAFLLGNIGPDPLFCVKILPTKTPYRNLGGIMHTQRPTELLEAFHERFIVRGHDEEPEVVRAYALGFLCHYLLDSIAHPLIYAQQYAYCDAGVEGLTRKGAGRSVHALIETELDEYVLAHKLGVTVDTFVPHRETLACPDKPLTAISECYARAVSQTYDMDVPDQHFATSVRMYRVAQRALDSKRDGLRSRVDYARILGKRYLHVLALSHSSNLRNETPFANSEHIAWPHPYEEDKFISASFDELYGAAFEKALVWVERFARADFSQVDCAELTGNVNFSGKLLA